MTGTYRFVAGDTASFLRVTCLDDDSKAPIDLTGNAITLRWLPKGDGALISRTMTKIVPETGGKAEYNFLAGELYDPSMVFEVRVTDAGGKVLTNLNVIKEKVRSQLA